MNENPDYNTLVYKTLQENIEGFTKSEQEFKTAMQDTNYADKVYKTLQENIEGFTKTKDEFFEASGLKKKEKNLQSDVLATQFTPQLLKTEPKLPIPTIPEPQEQQESPYETPEMSAEKTLQQGIQIPKQEKPETKEKPIVAPILSTFEVTAPKVDKPFMPTSLKEKTQIPFVEKPTHEDENTNVQIAYGLWKTDKDASVSMAQSIAKKNPYYKDWANQLGGLNAISKKDFAAATEFYNAIPEDKKTEDDLYNSAYSKISNKDIAGATDEINIGLSRPTTEKNIEDKIKLKNLQGNIAYLSGNNELINKIAKEKTDLVARKEEIDKGSLFDAFTLKPLTQEEWQRANDIMKNNIFTAPIVNTAESIGVALQGLYDATSENKETSALGMSRFLSGSVGAMFGTNPAVYGITVGLEGLKKSTEGTLANDFIKNVEGILFAPVSTALDKVGVLEKIPETERNWISLLDVAGMMVVGGVTGKVFEKIKTDNAKKIISGNILDKEMQDYYSTELNKASGQISEKLKAIPEILNGKIPTNEDVKSLTDAITEAANDKSNPIELFKKQEPITKGEIKVEPQEPQIKSLPNYDNQLKYITEPEKIKEFFADNLKPNNEYIHEGNKYLKNEDGTVTVTKIETPIETKPAEVIEPAKETPIEEIKPVEPIIAQEQPIEPEAKGEEVKPLEKDIKEVDTKQKELIKEQDKILPKQKKELLDDMQLAEKTIWKATGIKEENIPYLKESEKKGEISPFKSDNINDNIIKGLREQGFEVDKYGKIKFEIYGDGEIKINYQNILNIIDKVKKEFPTKTETTKTTTIPSVRKPKYEPSRTALQRGSLERNEQAYKDAKDNLEQAKKSLLIAEKNKDAKQIKLAKQRVSLFEEELKKEEGIYKEAQDIPASEYEIQQYPEIKNLSNAEEILTAYKSFGLEKEIGNEKEHEQVLKAYDLKQRGKDIDTEILNLKEKLLIIETQVKNEFGRKDGKGLKKPTNERDKSRLKQLNNEYDDIQKEIDYLKDNKEYINDLIEGNIKSAKEQVVATGEKPEKETKKETADLTKEVGISKEMTEKDFEEYGIPLKKIKKSDKILYQQGKNYLEKNNGDITFLNEKVKDGSPLSDIEITAWDLQRSKLQKLENTIYDEIIKAKESGEETMINLKNKQLDDIIDKKKQLLQIASNAQLAGGRSFRAFQFMADISIDEYTSLDRMVNKYKAATSDGKITPQRLREITELHNTIQDLKDKLDKREKEITSYEEQLRKKHEDDYIKETQRKIKYEQRRTNIARTKTELNTEFKDLAKQLSNTIGGQLNMNLDPKIVGIIAKIAKNRIEYGIINIEGIVDEVYQITKDKLSNVSKREIRDAISGYNKIREQKTKTQLQIELENIKKEGKLLSQIEDVKAGKELKKNKIIRKEDTQIVSELKTELENIKKESGVSDKEANEIYRNRLNKRISEIEDKIKNKDFSKRPTRILKLDEKSQILKLKLEAKKLEYDGMILEEQLKNRGDIKLLGDYILAWQRFALLSGATTLGKLTSAATLRVITTPVESIIGEGFKQTIGRIGGIERKSDITWGFNPKIEGNALSGIFTNQTITDFVSSIKTGKIDIDILYGKKFSQFLTKTEGHDAWLEFFGKLHGALKAMPKKTEFNRSFQLRVNRAAEKGLLNGTEYENNIMIGTLAADAYIDANRAIFMQDNIITDSYRNLLNYLENKGGNKGKFASFSLKYTFPIIKIATNYVRETGHYVAGVPEGVIRTSVALTKGIKNLDAKESAAIGNAFKKGSLGAAFMLLGYFNRDNIGGYYQQGDDRSKKDVSVGGLRMFGIDLPKFIAHTPLLECLQIGATIGRVIDKRKGFMKGITTAGKGVIEQVPFFNAPQDISEAIEKGEYGKLFGRQIGTLNPMLIQNIAKYTDTDDAGDLIKRKPETFWQQILMGIPYFRKYVPTQKEAKIEKAVLTEHEKKSRDKNELKFPEKKIARLRNEKIEKLTKINSDIDYSTMTNNELDNEIKKNKEEYDKLKEEYDKLKEEKYKETFGEPLEESTSDKRSNRGSRNKRGGRGGGN